MAESLVFSRKVNFLLTYFAHRGGWTLDTFSSRNDFSSLAFRNEPADLANPMVLSGLTCYAGKAYNARIRRA